MHSYKNMVYGAVLISISIYYFLLVLSNRTTDFLAPKMLPYCLFMIVICFFLGSYLFLSNGSDQCCHHTSKRFWSNKGILLIILLPFVTSSLLPAHSLNSVIAKNRQLTINMNNQKDTEDRLSNKEQEQRNSGQPQVDNKRIDQHKTIPDEFILNNNNFVSTYIDIQENTDLYLNKEITLTGFIHHPKNGKTMISRFVVQCCVADARLIGFPIQTDDQLKNIKNDTWVQLTGQIKIGTYKNPIFQW